MTWKQALAEATIIASAQAALDHRDWNKVVRLLATPEGTAATRPLDRALVLAPALAELARHDAAEEVLAEALADGIDDDLLELHASLADRRHDWSTARDRWRAVLSRRPQSEGAAAALGSALYRLHDFNGADEVLVTARALHPRSERLTAAWAWAGQMRAHVLGTWVEAANRWRAYLAHHFPPADESLNIILAFERAGALDDAETHCAREIRRHQDDPRFAMAWAGLAASRGDGALALVRWRASVLRFPDDPAVQAGEAKGLAALGLEAEGTLALAAALKRWPAEPVLLETSADLDARRGDHHAAAARWREAIAVSPTMAGPQSSAAAVIASPEAAPRSDEAFGMTAAELMLSFESLGDNCEFGMVQRLHGAEPVGLLRFTTLQPEYVLDALCSRFDGVGSREQIIIDVNAGEYVTSDRRFHMWSHTFIPADSDRRDQVVKKMSQRLTFLRRNLLYDLKSASKIFVYKSSGHELDDGFIRQIYEALNGYAANTLLVVRKAGEGRPAGMVEEVAPGLLHGYVPRLSPVDDGACVDAKPWLAVCQRAYELWTRRAALSGCDVRSSEKRIG